MRRVDQVLKIADAPFRVEDEQLRAGDEGGLSIAALVVLMTPSAIFVRKQSVPSRTVHRLKRILQDRTGAAICRRQHDTALDGKLKGRPVRAEERTRFTW